MNQWQPIETAPKDGTRIVAVGSLPRDKETVRACITGWYADRDTSPIGAVGWAFVVPGYGSLFDPTHWMPLPSPPEVRQ